MGRPLGSKNKPRIDPLPPPNPSIMGSIDGPRWKPNPADIIWHQSSPIPTKVVLSIKPRAFGDGTSEMEIDWPTEWRLPQVGESIVVEPGVGGFIQFIEWSPLDHKVLIALR